MGRESPRKRVACQVSRLSVDSCPCRDYLGFDLVSLTASRLFSAVLHTASFPLTFRCSKGESLPVTSMLAFLGVLWVFHDKTLVVLLNSFVVVNIYQRIRTGDR